MKSILVLALMFLGAQSFAIPARVLIIRHGEKPNGGSNDLSPQGFQRAQALTQLFNRQPALIKFGLPAAMFAFSSNGDHSLRGIETATPLAQSLGLTLNTSYQPQQTGQLAQYIMLNPDYDGRMVMIVWRHSDIQALAQAFGVSGAPAWNSSVFNQIWQIDFDSNGRVASFTDIPQNLLPGDH